MSNADIELTSPFEGRINAGKVVAASIGAGAVTAAKLGAGAVTKSKLGTGFLKIALVAGGAAGAITVTGIAAADALISVLYLPDAGAIDAMADLTSEFTISGANTISNTGGTATTDGKLLVIYQDVA